LFIPRQDGFDYPLDQDYEHFNECGTRLQGKLDEMHVMFGIIGTGQPSVLILPKKELSIERSPISRKYP
jgi:hypothetical protein